MGTLIKRLHDLEKKRAGPVRIWVRIDDGPWQSEGETLTSEELAARYADDVIRLHVVHEDMAADRVY